MARTPGALGVFVERDRRVAQVVALTIRSAASAARAAREGMTKDNSKDMTQDDMGTLMAKALSAGSGRDGETAPWGKWERAERGMKPAKAHQVVAAAVKLKLLKADQAQQLGLWVKSSKGAAAEPRSSDVDRLSKEKVAESRRFASEKGAFARAIMTFDEACRVLKHYRAVDIEDHRVEGLGSLVGWTPSEKAAAKELMNEPVFRSLEPASVLLAQLARRQIESRAFTGLDPRFGAESTVPQKKRKEFLATIASDDLIEREEGSVWPSISEELQRRSVERTLARLRVAVARGQAVPKLSQVARNITQTGAKRGKKKPL